MRQNSDDGSLQLALFNERAAGGRAEKRRDVMFEDICEVFEASYMEKGRASRAALRVRFLHLRPFFGGFKAAEITPDMIQRYSDSRLRESYGKITKRMTSVQSVYLELGCLKRAFLLARDRGLLRCVPRFPAAPPREPNQSLRRRDFIDVGTFEAIRAGMPPDLRRDAISFLYFSGWLPSWMYALRWSDVNFSERLIEFSPEGRTEEPHRLPFDSPAELNRLMLRARAARRPDYECPFVFHVAGRQITCTMMRDRWERAVRAAGAEGFVMYDLRRSSERNLLLSGVDEQTARCISGRRNESTFARGRITVGDLHAAMAKLGAFLDALKTGKVVPIGPQSARLRR
jgi:integrase